MGSETKLAECPWCGPNGDLMIEDLDGEGSDIGEETTSAAVVCHTCMAQGPHVGQRCHDEDEDGPLAEALEAAAIAAWNERLPKDQGLCPACGRLDAKAGALWGCACCLKRLRDGYRWWDT